MKVWCIRMWEVNGPEGRFLHTKKLVGVYTGFFFESEEIAKEFTVEHESEFYGCEIEIIPVGIMSAAMIDKIPPSSNH